MKPYILVDTNIILDFYYKKRARHIKAVKVINILNKRNINFVLLCTQLWEIRSVTQNPENKKLLNRPEGASIKFEKVVPVNEDFVNKYMISQCPYIKTLDLMILAYVLGNKATTALLTEDRELLKKAKKVGVKVYNIGDILQSYDPNKSK